jgi:hypothetical protein
VFEQTEAQSEFVRSSVIVRWEQKERKKKLRTGMSLVIKGRGRARAAQISQLPTDAALISTTTTKGRKGGGMEEA